MNLLKNFLAFIIVLAILALLAWGIFHGIQYNIDKYIGMQTSIQSIVLIAAITLLLSAAMIAAALRNLGRGIQKRRLNDEKVGIYITVMDSWQAFIRRGRWAEQPDELRLVEEIETRLVLLAAARVIESYNQLRTTLAETGLQSQETAAQLEKVLQEMRRDLGYVDWTARTDGIFSHLLGAGQSPGMAAMHQHTAG
jgi:uncharacterized membrane protein